MLRIMIAVFSLLLSMNPRAFAEAGLTGGQILGRAIGARSSGMGQAFTAVGGDTENIIYNPAGTAFIDKHTVSATYLKGLAEDNHGLFIASIKMGNLVITPALLYYNAGKMTANFSDGTSREVTAQEDKVGILSAAYKLTESLAIGGSFKYSKFRLGDTASATGRHYDIGILYNTPWGISLGASRQNMGNSIKFEEVGDPPPTATRAGIAYRTTLNPPNKMDPSVDLVYFDTLFTADMVKIDKDKSYYQTGIELNMKGDGPFVFAIRGGYLFGRDVETYTFGAGGRQGAFGIDYAYGGVSALNSRHQFTLSYKF